MFYCFFKNLYSLERGSNHLPKSFTVFVSNLLYKLFLWIDFSQETTYLMLIFLLLSLLSIFLLIVGWLNILFLTFSVQLIILFVSIRRLSWKTILCFLFNLHFLIFTSLIFTKALVLLILLHVHSIWSGRTKFIIFCLYQLWLFHLFINVNLGIMLTSLSLFIFLACFDIFNHYFNIWVWSLWFQFLIIRVFRFN